MLKLIKKMTVILISVIVFSEVLIPQLSVTSYAAESDNTVAVEESDDALSEEKSVSDENSVKSHKAFSAAIVVGVVAALAAVSMAFAISKSNEAIARQPEAASQIRSGLMLGLVFIETVVIYALIVAILVIFVL